jgi:hypothetical protein
MTKSMNFDSLEQRLKDEPLRGVPSGWRTEILSTARQAADAAGTARIARQDPPFPWFGGWLKWAVRGGFATVWLLILFFKLSAPVIPEVAAAGPPPSARDVLLALRRQASEASEFSQRPPGNPPSGGSPRSERRIGSIPG